ncbi:MAG: HAMP domain-containing histidine kinase [Candidatus Cloacimonetes bacterium]|nr:HAMP domain-containing histidine kinase [Candidatus Cloacimonadota bacterium]
MTQNSRTYFNLFFLCVGILFLSFQAFQFYLTFQTQNYFDSFGMQYIQKAHEDFVQKCEKHKLFEELLLNKTQESSLVYTYFVKEISSIEKKYYLDGIYVFNQSDELVLSTVEGKEYLNTNPEIREKVQDNLTINEFSIEVNGKKLARVKFLFSMKFPRLLKLQKNYLKTGLVLFFVIFVSLLVVVRSLFVKTDDLYKKFEQQKRLAEFGSISAGVAHDVRNPLNIINMQTQELLEMHNGDKETEGILFNIQRGTRRIHNTISALMVFEQEELSLTNEISLQKIINEAILLEDIESDLITMNVEDHLFLGNKDLFLRMLQNLLRNAQESYESLEGKVEIKGLKFIDHYKLSIIDFGRGIENIDKIFDPFYTNKNTGTGLGLLVVKDSCDRHNAKIAVLSKLHQGTEFQITLNLN